MILGHLLAPYPADLVFEAMEALQGLGYSAIDAERALQGVEGQDAGELIKEALKNLDNRKR